MYNRLVYSWKFSPGENFCQFRHLLSLVKFLSENSFDDYIEDMVTATTLVKILNISATGKVTGLGKIFAQHKFSAIRYSEFHEGGGVQI